MPHDAHQEPLSSDIPHSDEYEEICSDEVDRVVAALESIAGDVESENIRALLDEAADKIYALVYENEWSEEDLAA